MEVKNRGVARWDAQLRQQHIHLQKGHTLPGAVQDALDAEDAASTSSSARPGRRTASSGSFSLTVKTNHRYSLVNSRCRRPTIRASSWRFTWGASCRGRRRSRSRSASTTRASTIPQYAQTPEPAPPVLPNVLVNQIGYFPALAKIATVQEPERRAVGAEERRGTDRGHGDDDPVRARPGLGGQGVDRRLHRLRPAGQGVHAEGRQRRQPPVRHPRRSLRQAQVRRARVLLPAAQRHPDRDALRGRAAVGAPGRPRRRQAERRRHQRPLRGRQRVQLRARRLGRLVRRRRSRQVRRQRRHLGLDAAQLVGADQRRSGRRPPTSATAR